MSENSGIEWTDHTFNPWWGCAKVSPGCDHCYAERDAGRFAPGKALWGVDAARREFGPAHWDAPLKWNAAAQKAGVRHRVFCASMADVFDKNAPAGALDRLWGLIRRTPSLDWLILTKRVGNIQARLPHDWGGGYPNVWLGISVVNQKEADRDIPKLLATTARVRFLSCEPLLGPINLADVPTDVTAPLPTPYEERSIHWIIVGGESGPQARPMHPDWARSLRDQAVEAGVAFHFKQWGEWAPALLKAGGNLGGDLRSGHIRHLHAPGNPEGYFRDGDAYVERIGKRQAGRLLDGRTWDGLPEAAP